jgi:hypothetical protein
MDKVRSEDGTAIALDRVGEGPPIILVVGAFNDRATGAPLATALQDRFSVVTYDRRGRGDSGDTPPYAVEREVEDLEAIIEEVGGSPADVIGPPTDAEGGLFSEINDNSVAILLTYGTARILLAGDAEANEEEYMANGPYTGPLTIINVPKVHTL